MPSPTPIRLRSYLCRGSLEAGQYARGVVHRSRAPDEPTRACYKRPVPVIHDVAIVGGGVAGAATAVGFATKGSSVVLFERRDLARDPNRGDVIHPDARAILD